MSTTKVLSNPQNNPRPQFECHRTNLSTYSCSDQDVVSDEIIHSCDRKTSYNMDSVVFQGSKSRIVINLYPDDLKDPSTPLNDPSSSIISSIITPFLFSNINQNGSSVKSVLSFNHQKLSLIIKLIYKVQP